MVNLCFVFFIKLIDVEFVICAYSWVCGVDPMLLNPGGVLIIRKNRAKARRTWVNIGKS